MSDHETAHWGYVDPIDPSRWGDLDPAYALCKLGQAQSPIDLREAIAGNCTPVAYDYVPTGFRVLNNGHTIQVQAGAPNAITLEGAARERRDFQLPVHIAVHLLYAHHRNALLSKVAFVVLQYQRNLKDVQPVLLEI